MSDDEQQQDRETLRDSRRKFLKRTGLAAGAAGLAGLLSGYGIRDVQAIHEDPDTPTTITDEELDVARARVAGMHPLLPYDKQVAWDLPADISEAAPLDYLSTFGFGLGRFPDGDLVLIYRGGSDHLNDGVIRMRQSQDGGQSWGSPTTVWSDATYDLRSGGGGVTPTGRLIIVSSRYDPVADSFIDIQYQFSDDKGATWEGPFTLTGSHDARFNPDRMIPIGEGKLALFVYDHVTGGPGSVFVHFSEDDGRTWGGEVTVADELLVDPLEPHGAYLGGGVIIVLCRRGDDGAGFQTFRSVDNGATWADDGFTNFEAAHDPDNPVWMETVDAPSGQRMVICSWYCRNEDIIYVIVGDGRSLADDASTWILGTQTNLDDTVAGNSGYVSFVLRARGESFYGICYEENVAATEADLHFYEWDAAQVYTSTNVTEDRTYDADATSTAELADILGTLIADLRAQGIIR